ncbi:cysteine and histidine-rich domain-containing protein 1-like isoform X2 [Haliotis asinina]|uniref:cysteine and histidine-rich domain-containing protein 1-like isoform X2 n=1 Tax=Haliotis asinina TaxID=109174 RepID=UPI0035318BE7
MAEVQCYNKGCGQKFDPQNNPDDACTFHPGQPVFHDALKGWSCCDKRSTDFTMFLNYPGCTKGAHSNVKPVEPQKPKTENPGEVVVVQAPKQRDPIKPRNANDRPSVDEPMTKLKLTVGATLKSALEKLTLQANDDKDSAVETTGNTIKIGTSCTNNSCKCTYQGEASDTETCTYHPGVPIFHEGMKFWSCCLRKTSDFDSFLNQVGCEMGTHRWIKPQTEGGEKKACRFDWHQTGPIVCLSVFAKVANPDFSHIEANKVFLRVHIVFDGGKSIFEKEFVLRDVIDPARSSVKMLGTKVEINLRKAENFSWPSLEMPKTDKSAEDESK